MAFLQHSGFVPVPRNAAINIHVSTNATAAAQASTEPSVPSFARSMQELDAVMAEVQRELTERPIRSVAGELADETK